MAGMKHARTRPMRSESKAAELPKPDRPGAATAACEVCGNEYDKSFTVTLADQTHTFDSFECAIQALAPACEHCGCKVIGHGVEKDGAVFCCVHCAERSGVPGLKDRA